MGALSAGTDVPAWPAPTATGPVDATVSLPGSKSLTNRYLVLAALAQESSRLRSPLHSRDTALMAAGLAALGVIVEEVPGTGTFGPDWVITPRPLRGPSAVDCGLAGTVMRFVPPVAALAQGPVRFDGDPAARRRPMAPVVTALRGLGVPVDADGDGRLPLTVHGTGRVRGGTLRIDASASSQFVSGLLLVGARFDAGLVLEHVGPPIPSAPHVVMTVEALRDVGVVVDEADTSTWR
ncbi:MAG: 3-phosphoshikimate 1-carboxyvinyltransferase, partial [Kineosporiaceae bacterium]